MKDPLNWLWDSMEDYVSMQYDAIPNINIDIFHKACMHKPLLPHIKSRGEPDWGF